VLYKQLHFAVVSLKCILLTAAMTSAAVAMLLGNSVTHDSDGDLDTTLPNVILDQSDLMMLDIGFSDNDSEGIYICIYYFYELLYGCGGGCLGGAVVGRRTRDRKVTSSTHGQGDYEVN